MKNLIVFSVITLLCCACDQASDINSKNIKGYPFSLFEVQKYCTVQRQGDQYLSVSCELAKLKPMESGCEGIMSAGLKDPKFLCSGGLWMLNNKCYVEMLNAQNGNIKCRD